MSRIDTAKPGYPQFTGVVDLETGGQIFSASLARITKYADVSYVNEIHFLDTGTDVGNIKALATYGPIFSTPESSGKHIYLNPDSDKLILYGTLNMQEFAAAPADIAGVGQLWVKNDTPNTLWFTNDAGTDVQLGVSVDLSAVAEDIKPAANNTYSFGTLLGNHWKDAFFDGTVVASRLTSNVATGTAPFTVTSTTRVSNLNVASAGYADYAGYAYSGPFAATSHTHSYLPLAGGTMSGSIDLAADNSYYCGNVFSNSWNSVCSYNFVDLSPHVPEGFDARKAIKNFILNTDGGYDKDTLPPHVVVKNPLKNLVGAERIEFLLAHNLTEDKVHNKDGTNLGGLIQFIALAAQANAIDIESLLVRVEAIEKSKN